MTGATRARRSTPSFLRRLLGAERAAASSAPSRGALGSAHRAIELCRALLSERGEVSGALLAREALASYQSLDAGARAVFFDLLVEQFSPDPEAVGRSAERYRDEPTQANLISLQQAAEPPRQELFRRLNMAPGGTALLVEMHRGLLKGLDDHPQWLGIDADFVHLLRSWFNRGFLSLQRIDWRTSASVLEKLIDYEAVHAIQGWGDLRRRLQADRRCYAFFHPALPDDPLIFIEVALTKGMSATVQPLLDPDSPVSDPAAADCAMFYSITNCQPGLHGVSFGNFLIKQVAEDIGRELRRVRTFATISPIPGFRAWLSDLAESADQAAARSQWAALLPSLDRPDWHEDAVLSTELQRHLAPLCAHHLLYARQAQEPLDPVARFHLVNGARLERLNWLADMSALGMRQSAGMMVNYVYRLGEVERNHEAYARDRAIVASRSLQVLARQSPMTRTRGSLQLKKARAEHPATTGSAPSA
jgi:malonyl-CoA decarboxylase